MTAGELQEGTGERASVGGGINTLQQVLKALHQTHRSMTNEHHSATFISLSQAIEHYRLKQQQLNFLRSMEHSFETSIMLALLSIKVQSGCRIQCDPSIKLRVRQVPRLAGQPRDHISLPFSNTASTASALSYSPLGAYNSSKSLCGVPLRLIDRYH
ncbi:hypothetical protein AOLI_G00062840 [Acnodon oligacanthus]